MALSKFTPAELVDLAETYSSVAPLNKSVQSKQNLAMLHSLLGKKEEKPAFDLNSSHGIRVID